MFKNLSRNLLIQRQLFISNAIWPDLFKDVLFQTPTFLESFKFPVCSLYSSFPRVSDILREKSVSISFSVLLKLSVSILSDSDV